MNKELFAKDKLKEYSPIPFWSWNDRLDPKELRRQIRWMKENGFGGFFMHARGGLKTPYLSEEWMTCIEACCDEAKKQGMEAWAYDENGWPSGFVGGKLLEDPALRDMYIRCRIGEPDEKADITYRITADELIRVANPDGILDKNGKRDAETGNRIAAEPGDTKDGQNEEGRYMNLYLCRSASSVDILNPEVTDRFLSETHEKYREHFGDAFSENLKGFFTDEPQYYRWETAYTPMVAQYFEETYGEDIRDGLGLLFVEKKGYRRFRYRYWLAMQKLMLTNYAQKVYDWCQEHGVAFTGHYVEEVSMGFQIMCCGGVMPFYEYENMPGIDWLGRDTGNELSPRQLGSAARQLGKKQTLTETFGCCGWDAAPDEFGRIAGFLYACGVNRICHHLVPYSERGQRKRDYPAHFHPVNPWVPEHMKTFNEYFTKLGYLLGEGEEPVNVAILHPIRSAYFDYKRGTVVYEGSFELSEQDFRLRQECRSFSAKGIAYHFLDETLLEKHGFVEGDRIGCGKCTYTYLVLPTIQTMGAHTEELLHQFVEAGGKVLLLNDKPGYLEGEPFDYPYLTSSTTMEEIEAAQPFLMKNPDTELFCAFRVLEGQKFLFLQNASATESYTQEFTFADHTRSFRALDLTTMEWQQMPLTVTVPKNGSLLLFLSEEETEKKEAVQGYELVFDQAEASFDRNYLTIDQVRSSKDGISYTEPKLCSMLFDELLAERYEGPLWLSYEFTVNEIPKELHLLAEKEQYLECRLNGKSVTFAEGMPEDGNLWRTDLAGLVQKGTNSFTVRIDWHQTEATYYALFGENVTENLKNCIVYHSEIEAVYLEGLFGVYSPEGFASYDKETVTASRFVIGAVPRRMHEPVLEGLPFFRGKLTLRERMKLPAGRCVLHVKGHYVSAEVRVNKKEAGKLLFDRRLEISPYTHEGENEIEVTFCIGNRNLLGPFHSGAAEDLTIPGLFCENTLPGAQKGETPYRFYRFYPEQEEGGE